MHLRGRLESPVGAGAIPAGGWGAGPGMRGEFRSHREGAKGRTNGAHVPPEGHSAGLDGRDLLFTRQGGGGGGGGAGKLPRAVRCFLGEVRRTPFGGPELSLVALRGT